MVGDGGAGLEDEERCGGRDGKDGHKERQRDRSKDKEREKESEEGDDHYDEDGDDDEPVFNPYEHVVEWINFWGSCENSEPVWSL